MKIRFGSFSSWRASFLALVSWSCVQVSLPILAQEIAAPVQERPALNLQVLDSVEVRRGRDVTIYQRVAPPVLSPRPAASLSIQSAGLVESAEGLQAPVLSPEQQRRVAKSSEAIFLSATVYDRRVTELQWFENGRAYRAFSNADFNLLAGKGEIETADTIYWLIMGVGNLTSEETAAFNQRIVAEGLPLAPRQIPAPENFSATRAEYVLTQASATPLPSAETLAALDALHVFYDANKAALVEEQARLAVEQTTRAEAERIEASEPKRTVIQLWPKKSRVYGDGKK